MYPDMQICPPVFKNPNPSGNISMNKQQRIYLIVRISSLFFSYSLYILNFFSSSCSLWS